MLDRHRRILERVALLLSYVAVAWLLLTGLAGVGLVMAFLSRPGVPIELMVAVPAGLLLFWVTCEFRAAVHRAIDAAEKRRRNSRAVCPRCGYNLSGLGLNAGCPECGWAHPKARDGVQT